MLVACSCPRPCLVHATVIPCHRCGAAIGERCCYRNGRLRSTSHAARERRLTAAYCGVGKFWQRDRRAFGWTQNTGRATPGPTPSGES